MDITSPPSRPRTVAPRICPVAASTMTFRKPRVSSTSKARATRDMGIFAMRILRFCARLLFGQTDAAQLGIDENGIGYEPALNAGTSLFDEVRADDAEVVVGNVGESRAAFDVAQRVNSWQI